MVSRISWLRRIGFPPPSLMTGSNVLSPSLSDLARIRTYVPVRQGLYQVFLLSFTSSRVVCRVRACSCFFQTNALTFYLLPIRIKSINNNGLPSASDPVLRGT